MKFILKNLMETLVLQKLDETIEKLGCCNCPKCRMDIASYALNRLPAKYIVTYEGEVYSKFDALTPQYEADILNALYQAAQVVKNNPQHEKAKAEEPHEKAAV